MKSVSLAIITLLTVHAGVCEDQPRSIMLKESSLPTVTGNLHFDLFSGLGSEAIPSIPSQEDQSVRAHKSPYLAAGMSLVVPGTGEFYTEHCWESVAFFAADVAAWILAYHYDKKGDRQTDFFQNYADARWNVVAYAMFTEQTYLNTHTMAWLKPNTEGLPPWQRVDWAVLNQMERQVGQTAEGQYYSHNLPPYGDQQYYELIGKYQQFYQGWDDRDTLLTTYIQISNRLASSPQAHMIYYSIERGKANDYYNTASAYVTVAIVNHIVNAAYAALCAGWYNSAHAELGLQRVPSATGYTNVPVVKMRWEF